MYICCVDISTYIKW